MNKYILPANSERKLHLRGYKSWQGHKNCCLPISVGMPRHEGDKFELACEWANDNFDHTFIMMADTLQRYNMMLHEGLSESKAFKKSLDAGDKWLERNLPAINLIKNKTIWRWEDWRIHPEMETSFNRVKELYKTRPDFRISIGNSVGEFWNKRFADDPSYQDRKGDFFKLSSEYLLEETAACALFEDKYDLIQSYPGTLPKAWTLFKNNPDPIVPGLSKADYVELKFKKIKNNVANQDKATGTQ